jgi:hypothetical protein
MIAPTIPPPAITKSLAQRLSPKLLTNKYYVAYLTVCQKVASIARLAAGAFGFLTLIQVLDGPERYGAFSFFDTMPSRPSWQTASSILSQKMLAYRQNVCLNGAAYQTPEQTPDGPLPAQVPLP